MLITQCPDCHSLFRVSHGQLKMAGGKVRCGACLMVFDAAEHSLQKTNNSAETATDQQKHSELPEQFEPAAESEPSDPLSTTNDLAVEERQELPPDTKEVAVEKTRDFSPEKIIPEQSAKAGSIPQLNIAIEPVVLRSELKQESSPGVVVFWLIASLVAIGMLIGQYLWFERAILAKQQNLKPIYQLLCERISCDLQGVEGLKTLRTEQVIVRPHQMFSDLISLSIKLRNDAAFYQPFPAIEVSFNDLKGALVSRRTFQPSTYLSDKDSSDKLAPGFDLEIDLPLTDPGSDALSYSVQLRQSL